MTRTESYRAVRPTHETLQTSSPSVDQPPPRLCSCSKLLLLPYALCIWLLLLQLLSRCIAIHPPTARHLPLLLQISCLFAEALHFLLIHLELGLRLIISNIGSLQHKPNPHATQLSAQTWSPAGVLKSAHNSRCVASTVYTSQKPQRCCCRDPPPTLTCSCKRVQDSLVDHQGHQQQHMECLKCPSNSYSSCNSPPAHGMSERLTRSPSSRGGRDSPRRHSVNCWHHQHHGPHKHT